MGSINADIIEPSIIPEIFYDDIGHHLCVGTILKRTLWSWQIIAPDSEPSRVAVARLITNYDPRRFEQSSRAAHDAFLRHIDALGLPRIVR